MRARFVLVSILMTLLLGLTWAGSAYSQAGQGGRPPMLTPYPTPPSGAQSTPISGPATPQPGSLPSKGSSQFMPVSMFGMNLYLTGRERSDNQARTLGTLAAQAGVKWSREELSWANIEPTAKGQFNWSPYDFRISLNTTNGINVIGMLLTTPRWASTNPAVPDYYWYEPSNYNDYFDFVRAAVNRWKNQIHVWEIWNEPNHQATWNCLNNCDRAANYARLLHGAYLAVKSADPEARVLIGGLYVHDNTNEGMAFLDRVVAASGGAINFDALSIHTYMPDREPESMRPDSVVQNFQYRLYMVNNWIDAHGGRPGEIWITEDGRSTCTGCPFPWSEDEQASHLARMYGIAAAAPRVVQFDWFQFEDKFNNPAELYGGMSIVRDNLTAKPAYYSYKTAASVLDGATFVGQGPQMIRGNNPHQPDTSDFVGFDYKFTRGSTSINMVWRVNNTVAVNYPVQAPQVDVIDRDGGVTRLTASNGTIPLTLSPRPVYVVSVGCASRFSDVCPDHWAYPYVECMAQRQIIGGYADGTFRPNNEITRGQLSKIISNAANYNETPTRQTFQDVPPNSTFYVFIERMSLHGVISGYQCGRPDEPCVGPENRPYFRPNANATRGQISKIVASAANYNEPPIGQTFEDVPPTHPFYQWIQRLASRNIMSGYPCGGAGEPCSPANRPYFRWGANTTRAQISKIVASAFFPSCGAALKP